MTNEENESANIKAGNPLMPQQDNSAFRSIPVRPAPWKKAETGSSMNKERALNMFRTANQWLYERLAEGASCACGNCYLCAYNFLASVSTEQAGAQNKTEMPSPHRVDHLIGICDNAACDESAEYVLAATLTGAADEAGITPDGDDFETRCNQRKIFMGRVIEIIRERCVVQCDTCACSTFGVPGATCMSTENKCSGTMRAIATSVPAETAALPSADLWTDDRCMFCGGKTAHEPDCTHGREPSTATTSAAVEIAKEIADEYYFTNDDVKANWRGREQEVYDDIAAIISRHFPPAETVGEAPDGFYWRGRYEHESARLNTEIARLTGERDQFFRELGETQEKLISALAVIDVGTSDDPGSALNKIERIQSIARANAIAEAIAAAAGEHLPSYGVVDKESRSEGDRAYDQAVNDVVSALAALKQPGDGQRSD